MSQKISSPINFPFKLWTSWSFFLTNLWLESFIPWADLCPEADIIQVQSNEQSLHVGVVRVIFMTASRHGDKQICSISRVSFLSESPTPNGLPKHLDIMVYKAIGLRVDVYQYHLSSHGKLEQMDKVILRFIGVIYWLFLFIGFIYSIWWLYSLDLSIGFIHWLYLLDLMALLIGFIYWLYLLALFIWFGGFIYLPYLWALVSAYTVFILTANSVSFSHISERNTFTFLSIYISHVLMEKIFRFPLRHHSGLIKLTLLQLHHHTLLIKLTNATS